MNKRYVLRVGAKYYGVHSPKQCPEAFLSGQVFRAKCDDINDYQGGGYLKPGRFIVELVRPINEEEVRGLGLVGLDIAPYRVVVMRRYTRKKAPTMAWPCIRLVYFWQWRASRSQKQ